MTVNFVLSKLIEILYKMLFSFKIESTESAATELQPSPMIMQRTKVSKVNLSNFLIPTANQTVAEAQRNAVSPSNINDSTSMTSNGAQKEGTFATINFSIILNFK